MPSTARSLQLPGTLLSALGIATIVVPARVASLLGLAAPADFWARAFGVGVLAIGSFYLLMANDPQPRFARASIAVRAIIGAVVLVLVLSGALPAPLAIFVALEWGGAAVTALSLRGTAAAALLLWLAPAPAVAQGRATTMPAVGIDHVILGVDDLERGITEFATRTGVKPIKGGVHPGRGTQNALVSLGNGRYVEIMAPSHEAGTTGGPRTAYSTLTPTGWALHTDNVGAVVATLRGAAFKVSNVEPGARIRPDGVKLAWQTADVNGAGLEDAPFFIQWGVDTPHPSSDAPGGCTLESVRMTQLDPAPLARFFRAVKVDVAVSKGSAPKMTVALACPAGKVTFGG